MPGYRGSGRAGGRALAVAALLLEAVRAVPRAVAARHKGHPRDASARGALRLVHRPRRRPVVAVALVAVVAPHAAAAPAARGAARRAAFGAACRLVREPLLRVELLLA